MALSSWPVATVSTMFSYLYLLSISIILISHLTESSEVSRPRGVSISRASLYSPNTEFTCFDGSATIPFLHVNDDYCDCADGSDEPGTAACPHGFFHCTNAGHRPQNIPSSRVNDGICDCCDTSDEYGSLGATCSNNCNELGRAARIEAQKQAEVAKAGSELRAQLAKRGKELRLEKQNRVDQLAKDQEEADRLKQEKEALKLAAEELENKALEKYRKIEEELKQRQAEEEALSNKQDAFEQFNKLDANNDGKLQFSELQTQSIFDQNRDGEITEEEAKFFLEGREEMDWDEFLTSGWHRIKPLVMMNAGLFEPPREEQQEPEEAEEEEEPQQPEVNLEQDRSYHGHVEEVDTRHHDQDENDLQEEGEEEEEEEEDRDSSDDKAEVTSDKPAYDSETQQLIDAANRARSEFEEAERAAKDVQRELTQIKESFEKDFGIDDEFVPLDGECFEYSDQEYTYRLCPFDQASQRPKSGGAETRLGAWNNWAGPEGNKYLAMLYDRGQSCWNGPQRSATVKLICGTENALVGVSEPNRCEYQFDFVTPSICHVGDSQADQGHDEL